MEKYGLRSLNFSNIADDDVDRNVRQLSEHFPFCGERIVKFLLAQRGIEVERMRLRDSVHRVDEKGVKKKKRCACNEGYRTLKDLTICGISIPAGEVELRDCGPNRWF